MCVGGGEEGKEKRALCRYLFLYTHTSLTRLYIIYTPTHTHTHSALQDVTILNDILEETQDDLSRALPLFSKKRGPEAKAVVEFQASFDYGEWSDR